MGKRIARVMTLARGMATVPSAKSAVSCGDAAAVPFECREGVRVLRVGSDDVRRGGNLLRRR